jgi:hypothetical protein
MAVSAEHRALHHAIDDLRAATTSLRSAHGDLPVVARLRNDLERLILDVADADSLPAAPAAPARPPTAPGPFDARNAAAGPGAPADIDADGAYLPPSWEDVDDEGVGGFRGAATRSRR